MTLLQKLLSLIGLGKKMVVAEVMVVFHTTIERLKEVEQNNLEHAVEHDVIVRDAQKVADDARAEAAKAKSVWEKLEAIVQ